jgi:cell division cycle protein 20 (cofactor of APC complex)
MMMQNELSSGLLKTPPRPSKRKSSRLSSASPSFRTPTKTPVSMRRSGSMKPRMSPSPSFLRTPSSFTPTPNSYGGDRFIPSRRRMNIDLCRRALLSEESPDENKNTSNDSTHDGEKSPQPPADTPIQKEYKRRMLSSLCNVPLHVLNENSEPKGLFSFGVEEKRKASSSISMRLENPYSHDTLRVLDQFQNMDESSAVKPSDAVNRRIPSQPSRILDAPDLVDDYYLNLISWSKDNILAVALAHCVYLWNAATGDIQHLATIEGNDDYVTSVQWCTMAGHSTYIAIGTNSNTVQLWDSQAMKRVRTLYGHSGRVASIAWNQHWLTSGGRDSLILQHDVRSANHLVSTYKAHEQEVCGLKWNDDGSTLASGGNENYLCLWDAKMSSSESQRRANRSSEVAPRLLLQQHKAAVKALDWCPFHRGILASGGGTADRTIKLWNSNSGAMLNSLDTGSQVCSIIWSPHQRELCSSHGFSENQLILWKYGNGSNLTKVKELTGHTSRVLSTACSPDGSTVVSAAGDESLRFWDIFGAPPSRRSSVMPMGEMTFGMPSIR